MSTARETKQIEKPCAEVKDTKVDKSPDLLPEFPDAILKFTLFKQLGLQEASELAKHSQFAHLSEYKVSAAKLEYLHSILPEFLQLVAHGKQLQAEIMLKKNPELLLLKGTVTDYSGRKFEPLTGFQLATWALDWRMRDMFLHYLDKEEADRQFDEIKSEGIVYKIAASALEIKEFDDNGNEIKSKIKFDTKEITVRESHFNVAAYRKILKKYDDNYEKWSYEKCVAYWCQVVGWAQRLLPTYLAQEHCQNRHYPSTPLILTNFVRTLYFYDWVHHSDASWFPLGASKLGFDFGIQIGIEKAHGVGDDPHWRKRKEAIFNADMKFITALSNMLIQKFPRLKQQPQPTDEIAKETKSRPSP